MSERHQQPVKGGEICMVGRLNIESVQLPLGFSDVPGGQCSYDAVGQRHHRIVEEQIHLRGALRGNIAAGDEPLHLRIGTDAQRLVGVVRCGRIPGVKRL